MKKIPFLLLTLALSVIVVLAVVFVFIFPLPTFAAISTPWTATSTDRGFISPGLVNGNMPWLMLGTTTRRASEQFILANGTYASTSPVTQINQIYGTTAIEAANGLFINNSTSCTSAACASGQIKVSNNSLVFDTSVGGGTNGNFQINVNGLEKARFNSTGRLALSSDGTYGPASTLDVNGNASVGAAYKLIAAPTNGLSVQGLTGLGSTSPFARLSVHANNGDTQTTLFVVGSSTATATTTLFSLDNTGKGMLGGSLPLFQIGSGTPTYGYLANDRLNIVDKRNDYAALNVYNEAVGNCATADLTAANDLDSTAMNFADLGHTSSIFDGIGCVNNPFTGFGVNSTYLFDPTGNINFAIGSSSAASYYTWFGGGYAVANRLMTLLESGNLGIGTTSPSGKLAIAGLAGGTANLLILSTSTAGFATTTVLSVDQNGLLTLGQTNGIDAGIVLPAGNGLRLSTPGTNAQFRLLPSGNDIYFQNTNSSGNIFFTGLNATNLTGNVIFSLTGNLGIATSTPRQRLSVQGNALISGNLSVANFTATGTPTFSGISGSTQCLHVDTNGVVTGTGSDCGSGGGGTNYWTSNGAGTSYLNNNSVAGFPSFTATSTTATSSVTNALTVGKYLNVGAVPGYGFFPEDYIDVWNSSVANDLTAVNVGTAGVGTCAQSMYVMNGDNLILNQDFTTLSNTNTGYVGGAGSGCAVMSPVANAESTYLYQPTWDMDFVLGTTTQTVGTVPVGFKWSGNNGTNPFMVLTNNGKLGIGTTSPTMGLLEVNGAPVFSTSSLAAFTVGPNGLRNPAFSINASSTNAVTGLTIVSNMAGNGVQLNASSSAANEALTVNSKGTGSISLNSGTGGNLFQTGATTRMSVLQNTVAIQSIQNFSVTSSAFGTAATVRFNFVGAADTGITGGAESIELQGNFGFTRQHASNTLIPLQRDAVLVGATDSFATAGGVITDAAVLGIPGPKSGGTNATLATSSAIYVATTPLTNVTRGTGLAISAPTGGTSGNYAALLYGAVGISTSSPLGTGLSVNGTSYFTGLTTSGSAQTGYICYDANGQLIQDTTTCLVSALKFKENIHNLIPGLESILAMRPVTYQKKASALLPGEKQTEQMGFIADYTPEALKDLVVYDNQGEIHGFNYEGYTAVLTKAIQQQQAEIVLLQKNGRGAIRSAEENWQWGVIALLVLGFLWQQLQINKLKKYASR